MNPTIGIVVVVIVVPLLWLAATYNRLVKLRQLVAESWSGIDTELRRRYDLIPNLVEVVKGYAAHEREVLRQVAVSRALAQSNTGSPTEQAGQEKQLVFSLRQLFAVAENYPDLQADGQFLALQHELVNTEDRIQAARRFYNANVRDLNNHCQTVPSNLVASAFAFKTAEFFEVEAAVNAPIEVKLG